MKRVPRHWSKFEYFEPKTILHKLHKIRKLIPSSDLPCNIKNLRTRTLQPEREAWDTAIFCYLLSQTLELDIRFCREEESDFDSIFTWVDKDIQCFTPVQMKELVPENTSSKTSLNKILVSLRKYVDSSDLVVAIKLNRNIKLDLNKLNLSNLPVAEIWMFGNTSKDQSEWSLFGFKEGNWKQYKHKLPDN